MCHIFVKTSWEVAGKSYDSVILKFRVAENLLRAASMCLTLQLRLAVTKLRAATICAMLLLRVFRE